MFRVHFYNKDNNSFAACTSTAAVGEVINEIALAENGKHPN